jgi:large subunit ribosomal protein L19e
MNISAQKKMAAEILNCGINRVWVHPDFIDEVLMAITREDIRNLISGGVIKKRNIIGISKYRKNQRAQENRRGRHRGTGKRQGNKTARTPAKRAWINTIRPQREALKKMRDEKTIDRSTYRKMYLRAKGGSFKSVSFMQRFMEENKLIKKS